MYNEPPVKVGRRQSRRRRSIPGQTATAEAAVPRGLSSSCSRSASCSSTSFDDRPSLAGNAFLAQPKVLIVSKQTKHDYERQKNSLVSDAETLLFLHKAYGSEECCRILKKHLLHEAYIDTLVEKLSQWDIKFRLVTMQNCTLEQVDWADLLISAGGDGTFLCVASKIGDSRKSLVGINTDPESSVGQLCLKKLAPEQLAEALDDMVRGKFRFLHRQRIRVTLTHPKTVANSGFQTGVEISDNLERPETAFGKDFSTSPNNNNLGDPVQFLALNEVFLGDSSAARVSKYRLQLDDSPALKLKSSGFIACTGSGSTGWFNNTNRLDDSAVAELLRLAQEELGLSSQLSKSATRLAQKFNNAKQFSPSDNRMGYAIREPINLPLSESCQGFCQKATITSLCYNGSVVVDGGATFPFNEGTHVTLEIRPEDALQTIELL